MQDEVPVTRSWRSPSREGGAQLAQRVRRGCATWASARSRVKPSARGSRRSTASARACCAPTRSPPGSTRSTGCSTSSRPSAWRSTRSDARSRTSWPTTATPTARAGGRLHAGQARAMVRTVHSSAAARRAAASLPPAELPTPAGELEAYRQAVGAALRELGAAANGGGARERGARQARRCDEVLGRLGDDRPATRRHRRIQGRQGRQALSTRCSRSSRSGGPPNLTLCLRRREYQHHVLLPRPARASTTTTTRLLSATARGSTSRTSSCSP